MELLTEYGAWGLFLASFLAATILPLASEIVLVAVVAAGVDPWAALWAAAAGNTLGGMTSYFLGYFFEIKKVCRWMKIPPEKLDRMYPYAHRYGFLLGFLGFMPVIGDVVMIALGSLRCSWIGTLVTSAAGKTLRYYLIVFTQLAVTSAA